MSNSPVNPQQPPARPRRAGIIVLILATVLLAAAGVYGFRYADLRLALSRARREFSARQFMRAEFWAARALRDDHGNVEAARLMAEINEAQDKAVALSWRIKVVQLHPGASADIMALAKSALRFGQAEMAFDALESLPVDFKDHSADYHEVMAGCALAARRPAVAEEEFAKAAEIDPGDPLHQINLAAFRMANSPSADIRAAATGKLVAALDDPRVSLLAARALLGEAIRRGDSAEARKYAEKLRALPGLTLADELNCLVPDIGAPAFVFALDKIRRRVQADAPSVVEVADWLNSHGMSAATLQWFPTLPAQAQSAVRVQIAASEAYLAASDWNGLQAFLAKCQWGDTDFLRQAMLIRCERELGRPWEQDWKKLAAEVDAAPPDGLILSRLLIGWNWRDEVIELLEDAASRPVTKAQALRYLWDIYSQSGETGKLWRIAREQGELDPANPAKKNNEAFLSLLLYGSSDRASRLAREAWTTNPGIAEWAATYAYALHLDGKETEARKVMDDLPPGAFARPGIALYYAIILSANGDEAKARDSLAKLNPEGMLPEERKLAADLARKLGMPGR